MISELLELLKNNEKIYAWNFKVDSINSYQLYFIKQKLDMNREVKVDEYNVTIFTLENVNGKEMIGSSSFNIYPSMSMDEVKAKLEEQISFCKYSVNKPYAFPKKVNLKPVSKELGFSGYSLKEAAFVAADALFEADKFDKGYINSSEIFINFIETRFFDSNGNVFLYTREKGEIELIATWKEKGEEVEIYKYFEFDNLDSIFIQNEATKVLIEASNRVKAIKTPSISNIKVLLTGDYVKEYFLHFAYKANTDSIYSNVSTIKVGENIQNNARLADKISIRLEPTLKKSTYGAPFDKEGIGLKRLHVIEKGVVKNLWGSNAKSQYINKPVNGTYSNFVVSAGTLTQEELEDENYLEIIALSGFEIDELTGDFGSEIRLAYLHQKNKEMVIVTGGSISGNVYQSINTVKFNNDTKQNDNFIGPINVLIDNVSVNGGE